MGGFELTTSGPYLGKKSQATPIHALVISRTDSYNALYVGLLLKATPPAFSSLGSHFCFPECSLVVGPQPKEFWEYPMVP